MENLPLNVSFRFDSIDLLWTVENIYSQNECNDFISMIEKAKPEFATNNQMFRDQDRAMVDDPKISDNLFERLRLHLPGNIAQFKLRRLNERLRFYRYRAGQKFSPHMDHWYQPSESEISLLTVLTYLNSNFTGGETRFMGQLEEVVTPKSGLVAVFQHKVRHEGCEVLSGTKYAFRTDVIYGIDP